MEEFAEYAGRLLADRYRLPQPPAEEYDFAESLAWDTASGQEVLVRQVPLPEVVEAEVMDDGEAAGLRGRGSGPGGLYGAGRATRRPADPVVRRAVEAAVAASQVPDHPRLDQVFDVFVEGDGLWVVSELVPARSLAALLAEQPLGAHRAAEIAADLLAALRVVHEHGWAHRNVTARTVLICEDGRALLTGLAVGAAEEALCGYDPLPEPGQVPVPPSGGIPGGPGLPGGPEGFGGDPHDPDGPGDDPGSGYREWDASPRAEGSPGAGAALEERPGPGGPPPGGGRAALAAARDEGRTGPGRGHGRGRGPATWTGSPLPEGFDPRQDPAGDARDREIFGFEGVERDTGPQGPPYGQGPGGEAVPQQGGHGAVPPGTARGPVAHGYETGEGPAGRREAAGPSERAARRGAIAAYRAGTQRAAAEARESDRHPSQEPGGRGAGEAGGEPGEQSGADWWATPPGRSGGLDDDVRWLPSDEDEVVPDALDGGVREVERDEVYGPGARGPYGRPPRGGTGPTALPGARHGESRSVRATWRTRPDGGADEHDGGYADSDSYSDRYDSGPDEGPGPYGWDEPGQDAARRQRAGDEDSGLRIFDAPDEGGPDDGYADEDGQERPWGGEEAAGGRYRGPATALAAERARHTRMTVVGPVTERWAPEQAGPVYENWRLAPPVGPAADLWALGALLFRSVQGHAPYPEDSAAELVQMVCAEPPAFAEDCGPLRPVVESLMRQDPTERPDFEVLRGWLRSLIRSAPEPEAGRRTVTAPVLDPGEPADPRRLPIVRRRGELVRRRKREKRPAVAERRQRHKKRGREKRPARPRRLGRMILGLVLLGLAAAVAYAMWFMPEQEGKQKGSVVVPTQPEEQEPGGSGATDEGDGGKGEKDGRSDGGKKESPSGQSTPETGRAKAPKGYNMSRDAAGFQVAVPEKWDGRSTGANGQVLYNGGDMTMIIVKGRDSAKKFGKDPSAYQRDDEPELDNYRDSSGWAATGDLRTIEVGDRSIAEGRFEWKAAGGQKMYARNRAMLLDGKYHVLLVQGSQRNADDIDRHFEAVKDTYSVTRD